MMDFPQSGEPWLLREMLQKEKHIIGLLKP
jgi:hypothetical protein